MVHTLTDWSGLQKERKASLLLNQIEGEGDRGTDGWEICASKEKDSSVGRPLVGRGRGEGMERDGGLPACPGSALLPPLSPL